MVLKAISALGLIVIAWLAAAGVAEALSRSQPPRGQMVDIGGRSLRLLCEGQAGQKSTVWMEAGAFGGAADFTAVQHKLAAHGFRACGYDRAGMGYSDPGPSPRDADAIAGDLERLIAASGERGPFILMAHSMGGLYVRAFAGRHPDQVAGLVLIDAVTPELMTRDGAERFFHRFLGMARLGAAAGTLGLTKPLYFLKDRIGLPPEGRREKQAGFVSGRQARTALREVESWPAAARQAADAGPLRADWPVAVVTAGRMSSARSDWEDARRAPERASRFGAYANVPEASHTTVLSDAYNDAILKAAEHVAAHAGAPLRALEP